MLTVLVTMVQSDEPCSPGHAVALVHYAPNYVGWQDTWEPSTHKSAQDVSSDRVSVMPLYLYVIYKFGEEDNLG